MFIVKVSNPVKDSTSHPLKYVYNWNLPVGLSEAGIIVFAHVSTVMPVAAPDAKNVRLLLLKVQLVNAAWFEVQALLV